MVEYAYKMLLESIKNNELFDFVTASEKYLVAGTDSQGWGRAVDYNSMALALCKYIDENPSNKEMFQKELIDILKTYNVNVIRPFVEMVFTVLRYYPEELGFVTEELLIEVKKVLLEHKETIDKFSNFDYEYMDELAYATSGKHIM